MRLTVLVRFLYLASCVAVIARFIQRLTLFAFAAHAVLGCCWHHSHAVGNDCCAEHGTAHADISTVAHDHAGHRCGLEDDGYDQATEADFDRVITSIEAACCDGSNSDSHDFNEARCSYVTAKVQTFDFQSIARFIEAVHWDSHQFAVTDGLLAHRFFASSPLSSALTSSGRCADLQSWQI
ncbi:hypothetical protein Poly59_40340 [Rubripirellula reticaptiva]|uniref:Uncharacterized protein n=2 Tax=Rubripirellula reticaptiva TaxID=2528013 RepID=A0A5C6EPW9_9BACT|nr:hypothetical protein Poly59_40340 [Rubripirellula reticaptiva]